MNISRIDHIGLVVNDLPGVTAFFVSLGLELKSESRLEGEWIDRIVNLSGVQADFVVLQMPNSQLNLELTKFHPPHDAARSQHPSASTPGIRHIAFDVEDIEAFVAALKKKGYEMFSDIQITSAGDANYKLCYFYGPEGIILKLAQHIK